MMKRKLFFKKRKVKKEFLSTNDFVEILTYFRIAYENKANVYYALLKAQDYSKGKMKDALETLTTSMINDSSITPFINFMNEFNNRDTHTVVLAIYQLINHGGNAERIMQFNVLYEELMKIADKEINDKKVRRFELLQQLPLLAMGIIMFSLLLGIFTLIGEQLYG